MSMLLGTRRALLGRRGLRPFDFDPAQITFTPAMAIRAGALFGGAVLPQGHLDGSGTPDVLSFTRGAQVHDNWYENFDPYQGTIVITRLVPEWDGNDGVGYNVIDAGRPFLRKNIDGDLELFYAGAQHLDVSVIGWTAGTGYSLATRWDARNPIDGTNYASTSINNASTFGNVSTAAVVAPDDPIYIGSNNGTSNPANAIEEGYAVSRLPLWDGETGVDINGSGIDIVAALYNGGAYEDLAKLIPAWHICSFLCTDSTPGALGTAGQMWGWPFADNVFGVDGWCAVNYAASGWVTQGAPTAGPINIADTVDAVFGLQGYEWLCSAANEGPTYSWAGLTPGANYLLVVNAHEEGVTTTGANLYVNGDMELYAGVQDDGVSDTFTGYSQSPVDDPAGNRIEATATVHGGANALKISYGNAVTNIYRTLTVVPGARYVLDMWTRGDGAQAGNYRVYDQSNAAEIIGPVTTGVAGAAYAQVTPYFTAPRGCTAVRVYLYSPFVAGVAYFDDVSVLLTSDDIRISIVDNTNGGLLTNFPDWDFGAGSGYVQMAEGVVTFELPTIADHGVGADCTAITIKVLGTIAGQSVFLHQAILQINELSNPSLETFQGGNPDIPDDWVIEGLDANESQPSSAGGGIIHSGLDCIEFAVGASNEGIYQVVGSAAGSFLAIGGMFYGDGTKSTRIYDHAAFLAFHNETAGGTYAASSAAAAWDHVVTVSRSLGAAPRVTILAEAGAGGLRYADDLYAIPLRPVTLAVTPRSLANSQESGGVSIEGYDNGPMVIPAGRIFATEGWLRIGMTHRHDNADQNNFGELAPFYFTAWGDATNNIRVEHIGAFTMRLAFNDGGGVHLASWAVPTFAAGDFSKIEVQWDAAHMELRVDGVVRINIVEPVNFAVVPTTWWPGTDQTGAQQIDMVFTAP